MTAAPRADGRADDELRPIKLTRDWLDHAAGSVLVEFGRHPGALRGVRLGRRAALAQGVRPRLGDRGVRDAARPRPTPARTASRSRAASAGAPTRSPGSSGGRCGRSSTTRRWARTRSCSTATCSRPTAAPAPPRSPGRTSRWPTPAPTSGRKGALKGEPLTGSVAAVSVGIIDGVPRLDLPYEEDVRAETDMNVVMTGDGRFVEVQGTAEAEPFDRAELDALLTLGAKGCADLTALQQAALVLMSQVFLASRNPKKLAEMQRILAEHLPGIEVLGLDDVDAVRRAGGDRADLRGQRPAQGARGGARRPGCRPSPTTAASASTRSTGCPASSPRGGQGCPATVPTKDRANNELLLAQLADVPDERRTARFRCAVVFAPADPGGRRRARRRGRDARPGHPRDAGRRAGSATTCCSAPTATTSPPPSCRPTRRTRSPTGARRSARSPRSSRRR